MGDLATPQALLHRWEELQHDPALRDLPYKIELNAWGKVEMSPASVRHGQLQAALAAEFARQLGNGVPVTECPLLTSIGVRVPDLAWASADFMSRHAGMSPLPRAPEIADKTRAYLLAGAQEVWLVSEDGKISYLDGAGEKARSSFPISATLPDPTKGYP